MKLLVLLTTMVFFLACGEREALYRGVTLHLTIEIDNSQGAIADPDEAIDRVLAALRARVDALRVRKVRIERVGKDRIIVELAGVQDVPRAKSIIQRTGFLEFKLVTDGLDFIKVVPALDSLIVGASPGLDEPRPLTALLLDSGEPGVLLVEESQVETVQGYLALPGVSERLRKSISIVWGADARRARGAERRAGVAGKLYHPVYILKANPVITSEYLTDAQPTRDPQFNQPMVLFQLTREGGRIFQRATSQHVGDRIAIVLDERVQGNPPVIRDPIGRRGQIELGSGASLQDARDLALILRTGALPAPIKIVEERTVGPEPQPQLD